jgi:hypothetical protein
MTTNRLADELETFFAAVNDAARRYHAGELSAAGYQAVLQRQGFDVVSAAREVAAAKESLQ